MARVSLASFRELTQGRRALREFSWLTGSTQLSTIASMAAFVVLVRSTSPEVTGQVVLAQSMAALVLMVLDIRFEDALQFYFANIRESAASEAETFFWRVVRFDAYFGLVVSGVMLMLWALTLVPAGEKVNGGYLALAICAGALGTSAGSLKAGLAVTNSLSAYGRLSAMVGLSTAAMMALGAMVFGGRGYLMGAIAGSCLQVVALVPACRSRIPFRRVSGQTLPEGFLRYLLKSSLATSFALGAENGSITMAGWVGGPLLPAVLKIAQAPGRLVQAFFSPISAQAFPRLAHSAAQGDRARIYSLTNRATMTVLVVGTSGFLLCVPLMSTLVGWVYGERYHSAALASLLFVAAGVLRSGFAWAKVYPLAIGRPGLRLWTTVVDSAITLGGTWLLVAESLTPEIASLRLATLALVQSFVFLAFWLTVRRLPLPNQKV